MDDQGFALKNGIISSY